MKKVTFLLAAILVFGVSNLAKAQDSDAHKLYIKIEKQAMIAIEGENSTDVRFESDAFDKAGEEITFKSVNNSNKLWLNYSSIVNKGGTNTISAKVSSLPAGLKIQVAASESVSNSDKKGHTGTGHTVDLTTGGVTIVDGIKSCYTGSGSKKGHELVYSVSTDENNYGLLEADNIDLTVTYTISEN
nr:hypothetical protein [uncultured Draconibacterium sp.]